MAIVPTDPLRPEAEVIKKAVEVLNGGGVVAAPTETVYGLFAHAKNDVGCRKVFEIKKRPPDNPLIIHVDSIEAAKEVGHISPEVEKFLERVWPGPVTVVVRSRGVVSRYATAGLDTVAIRAPAHPIPLAVIRELEAPIAGPSANRAGRPSPTTAQHVSEDLGEEVDMIIDGGPAFFGVESTIVDMTRRPPALLRPGPFTVEELEKLLGPVEIPPSAWGLVEADRAMAPGMKYRHYAPDTPLVVVHFDIEKAVEILEARGVRVAVLCIGERCPKAAGVIHMGGNLYEVAKNLYHALRQLDKLGVDVGLVPAVEERGLGLALMNRLRKAAGGREVYGERGLYELGLELF